MLQWAALAGDRGKRGSGGAVNDGQQQMFKHK